MVLSLFADDKFLTGGYSIAVDTNGVVYSIIAHADDTITCHDVNNSNFIKFNGIKALEIGAIANVSIIHSNYEMMNGSHVKLFTLGFVGEWNQ